MNREVELAKRLLESNGYKVKMNEAEEHAGWEYYEHKPGHGPWSANAYYKDVEGLSLSIYPPQEIPGESEPGTDWHAQVEAVEGYSSSIDKYETGFNSFEEAEAWINSQIKKYDPEGDKLAYNQKILQSAIERLSKVVSMVPSELRSEFTSQAIKIIKSHK